jgi:predicted amidophosphoribosyltransferase
MGVVWPLLRAWLFPVWCIGCAAPGTGLCAACAALVAPPAPFRLGGFPVWAAASYAGLVRDAIVAMKRGERAYLDPLASLVTPLVPVGTVLVPVRTTRGRAAERGFDQAVALALRAARLREAACADILRKRGGPQRGRGRAERLAAHGRFSLQRGAAIPRAAILFDDVVTTGATLSDAAATLELAGCRVTGAVVVASTPPGRETPRSGRRLLQA